MQWCSKDFQSVHNYNSCENQYNSSSWRVQSRFEPPQNFHSHRIVHIYPSDSLLKSSILKVCLNLISFRTCSMQKALYKKHCQKVSGHSLRAAHSTTTFWDSHEADQNVKRKMKEYDVHMDFGSLQHLCENLVMFVCRAGCMPWKDLWRL